jgi:hypothetical protein
VTKQHQYEDDIKRGEIKNYTIIGSVNLREKKLIYHSFKLCSMHNFR